MIMMDVASANNSVHNSTIPRKYLFLPFDGRVKMAMFITMGVFCVYGTAANALILYLKKKQRNQRRRSPRKPFNRNLLGVFIQSLSGCHILFCSIAFPAQVMFDFIDVTSSNWFCKLSWFLRLVFPTITINHLLVLAIEIYLSIVHPFVVPSARTAKSLAAASWIAGGLIVFMPAAAFSWTPQTTGPDSYTLMCLFEKTFLQYRLPLLLYIVINLILPALVIIFLSYRIMTFLKRKKAAWLSNPNSQRNVPDNLNARAIVTVLFIFFLPYSLFLLVSILKIALKIQEDFASHYLFLLINSVLAYTNAAISPTVFLLRQPDLQESFKYNVKSKFFPRKGRVHVPSKSSATCQANVQAVRNTLAVSGLQEQLEMAEISSRFRDMSDTQTRKGGKIVWIEENRTELNGAEPERKVTEQEMQYRTEQNGAELYK